MTYYHGTSNACNIFNVLLPPTDSLVLREEFRDSCLDVVFITTSLVSARKYAHKAVGKFGGKPVVYSVLPIGYCWYKGNGDHLCYKARIISELMV